MGLDLTPQQRGDAFEERFAAMIAGDVVPQSGGGRWAKMDVGGLRILWSLKATPSASFSVRREILDEVERAVRGPGGVGGETLPGVAVELGDGTVVCLMEASDLLEFVRREPPSMPMSKGEARRRAASMTPIERRLAEEEQDGSA